MNSLEDRLNHLKELNKTISSVEDEVRSTLTQNQQLSKIKNDLEEQVKELNQKNEELLTTKSKLSNKLNKKEEEIFALKNQFSEQNTFDGESSGNISLGINNLAVRKSEAIYDALSYFDKKCPYCNEDLFVTTSRKQFEIDHFYPVVKGGQDVPWNLLPVCQSCNRKKKDSPPHVFLNIDSFRKVSEYLRGVHEKFKNEAIDSYTFKEKLSELLKNENQFIKRNIHSDFITSLLYIAEEHHIIKEEIIYATKMGYNESDENASIIAEFLEKNIPENWHNLNLLERRKFLKGEELNEYNFKNLHQREIVCTAEIWCEAFGKERQELNRLTSRKINTIMNNLVDWKKGSFPKRFAIYGRQRFYERVS
ncbi:HNH endonuclease signature motif containing protein [Salegentibacter sp. Hel_I_6]|uniref:HNH endonuclease signature motif containing protein n=1 Tax=Salegentibacter sp. Hel_I_6 TaxID=1250278 RepID=UPI00055C4D79|nr:HNH endonuclease signature motif containing protein [Salegentibacter sp. Hel_I_6]